MKIRDFIKQEICIDVYDNVCEELAIAFDGPVFLTDSGKRKFKDVLGYEIVLHNNGADIVGIVDVDDDDEAVFERKLRKAREFFESLAGYCTVDEYKRWFEVE